MTDIIEQNKLSEDPILKGNIIALFYTGRKIQETLAALDVSPYEFQKARDQDPQFDNAIRSAFQYKCDVMVDNLESIHETIDDPFMAKVVSENLRWIASKRHKDVYGDKLDIEVNETIDIRATLEAAKHRTLKYIDDKSLLSQETEADVISVPVNLPSIEHDDPLS